MKVLIGAFGTRGDVQPMVALTHALTARGHTVRVAVPPSSIELAKGYGLDAFPVGMSYEEVSRRVAQGSFREVRAVMPMLRGEIAAQLEAMESEAKWADVLVGASVFTVGTLLGELLSKPFFFVSFCPQLIPSAAHPSPGISKHGLPGWLNRFSWTANEWAWGWLIKDLLNDARVTRGLQPVGAVWPALIGATPVVACDAALAPAADDFHVPIHQPGAFFVDDPAELSPELEAFLSRGAPPVYVGFGSMSDPDPRRTTARLLESLRRAGVRAVVSRGWAGLELMPEPDVLLVGSEPHAKLFPRCAAVVHHGGAGTTHAAARAGTPQVVMPQILDQHYWAHRLTGLGVGLSVGRHATNPQLLADAVTACLAAGAVREKARALAGSMRTDAAAKMVDLMERTVAKA